MSRAPRRSVPILTACLLAPLATAQAPAFPRPGAEDVLPASTYACLQFAGLEAAAGAAEALDAARLVRHLLEAVPDATMQRHVEPHMEQAAAHVRQALQHVGLSPAAVRAVLQRPMALGIGRLTLRGLGPSVALVIDEGNAARSVDEVVEAMLALLRGLDGRFVEDALDVPGAEGRRLRHPEGPQLLLARGGGMFVATNSEGQLREILATAAGRQPGLAAATVLGAQRERLGATPIASAFVHTEHVLSMLAPHLPYEAAEIGAAFGVQCLGGVYAACGADGGEAAETVDIALRGDAGGLLKAAFAGPADFGAAAMCSADTVAFATVRCNLPALMKAVDGVLDLLPAQPREQARRQMQRGLARGLGQAGMTPEQFEQLLQALGGSVSVAVTLDASILPQVLLFVPVRDRDVVAPWIERLAAEAVQATGQEWSTRTSGDAVIRSRDVQAGPFRLSPSFALTGDWLIVASEAKALLAALTQRGRDEGSLAGVEDFAAAARDCAGASGFVHLRLDRGVELRWRAFEQWVVPLLDALPPEVGVDGDVLPDREALAGSVGTLTTSLTVDEDGVRLRSRGALAQSALLLGAARLLDDVLTRAAGKVY